MAGVAEAARRLLAIENFEIAVNGALEAIAQAANIDRIFIFEHHAATSSTPEQATCPYEWTVPTVVLSREVPDHFPMVYGDIEGFSEWLGELKAGKCVQKLKRDMSAAGQAMQEIDQALSVLTVPILIDGEYWGNFGFDDCTNERVWSEAEIAVLKTAAATFAAALQRRGSVNTLRRRDELLDSVNAATQVLVANENLAEAIPAALQILGEGTRQDRAYIFENVVEAKTEKLLFKMPYEWVAPHIPAAANIQCFPLPADSLPDFIAQSSRAGKPVQFLTRDLDGIALALNEEAQTLSLVAVPIKVFGQWWGILGFDDCAVERVWSQAEIAVLETAAACLGSAIERDRTQKARAAAERTVLVEREKAAQARGAEIAKVNRVLKETLDTLATEPALSRFVGYVLQAIAQQFESPFLEYWRSGKNNIAYLELVVINGAVLTGKQLAGHHGVEGLVVPRYAINADDLFQRTQYAEYNISSTDEFIGPFYKNLQMWCQKHGIELPGRALNFPIVFGEQSFGAIAIFLPKQQVISAENIKLGYALSNQVALAVQLTQLAEKAKQKAVLQEQEAAAKVRAAELEAHSQTLVKRDRILEATAAAANVMLLNDHFEDAVNKALQTVGEGLDVDRILLGKHYEATEPDGTGHHKFLFEWNTTDVVSQISHPKLSLISDEGIEFALDMLVNGNVFGGIVDELSDPFRSSQIALGVQSTYGVPIHVSGQYWGVMAFDDCHYQTRRSEAELEALKTLANCIGSAIERNQMRQAREAAEQAVLQERERATKERAVAAESHNQTLAKRDRILQATATASNVLLHGEQDFNAAVSAALKILGESIGFDRIAVGQQINDSIGETSGFIRFLYEWNKPDISSQLNEHEGMTEFWWDEIGLQHWYEANLKGEAFGQLLEDLPEPFRSLMAKVDVKSTHNIPIVVEGQFWGVFGIDYCHERKLLSQTDLDALKTAANCIGSAIAQENMRQAREAAEQAALIERERAARADELEAANQVLSVRDQWLQATAAAANKLLSTNDVAASVNAALTTIGENLECDRLGIMHYRRPNNRPADEPENGGDLDQLGSFQVLYEWHASGAMSQLATDELVVMPANNFADWTTRLMAGEAVGGEIAQQAEPFRSQMQALGTLCAYAVPIFIATETGPSFWGLMFIDYCQQVRQLRPSELAVFKTAATCVGSAVYQEQVRQDKAAQERAKLLGSVAQAANLLLRATDYTTVLPEVTRLLGEAVGSDRCSVTQNIVDDSLENGLGVKLLYEWCAEGIASLPASATDYLQNGLRPVTGSFIEFHQAFSSGKVVNFLVADLLPAEKAFMEAQGNTSMLIVPIMVNGMCWGEIGFDNCGTPRLYDEAEIATLQIAAENMANAIARQAQEASVREAEERYRNLIELSMEGIYRLELDEPISRDLPVPEQVDLFYEKCSVAEANDAFAKMYGYHSAADMLGWRLTDFHVKTSPQNIEFLSAWLGSADCRISNSESEELDVSGNIHCFLNNVIGIVEDNKLIRVWGTQTEITALKQAQKAREEAEKAILTEREQAARNRATELAKTNEAIGKTLTTLTETPELDEFLGQMRLSRILCKRTKILSTQEITASWLARKKNPTAWMTY
ncbi:MAG: GAF domain-containing protein [Phormidesmis sp.]